MLLYVLLSTDMCSLQKSLQIKRKTSITKFQTKSVHIIEINNSIQIFAHEQWVKFWDMKLTGQKQTIKIRKDYMSNYMDFVSICLRVRHQFPNYLGLTYQ